MVNWWGLLVSVRGHKEKTPNKQTHCKSTHWKWGLSYCSCCWELLCLYLQGGCLCHACSLLLSNLSNASEDAGQKWQCGFVGYASRQRLFVWLLIMSLWNCLCHLICVNNIVEVMLVRAGVLPSSTLLLLLLEQGSKSLPGVLMLLRVPDLWPPYGGRAVKLQLMIISLPGESECWYN